MDPPLVAFANICMFGVIFILFASNVDSTEQWQPQPVQTQPFQPNPSQPVQTQPFQPNPSPPPPSLFKPAPPPPSLSKSAPPPKSSRSKRKRPPGPARAPSLPPNGRPFVSAPPPIQDQRTYPNVLKTDNDIRNDLGRKIGCIFAGVAIIMQVIFAIFLIIKRRQLSNPDYVH